jgi:PHD/YefM family antitoxin component YafN of YafNO toxin-antitoxin module
MISSMEKTISVTDLVRNASRIADDIEAGTIYRVTRGGRGSMVLVDEEYYQGWKAAIEEMQRPGWRAAWERSNRDIAEGKGRDLDAILKDLRLDDSANRRRRTTTKRAPTKRSKPSGRGSTSRRKRSE